MNNLNEFIVKNKYDITFVLCLILMYLVSVLFVIPAIISLVIGESKKEI